MRRPCRLTLVRLACLIAFLPSPVAAQTIAERVAAVVSAMNAGEFDRAAALSDSLATRFPGHPTVARLRAAALAGAGREDDAAAELRRLIVWDARYARAALGDSVLAPLRARFPDVEASARRADLPVARGRAWATVSERDLVPEGTAYDPATRSVLLGSLNKRTVVAITPDGTVSDRVARGDNGLASVAGIHVDAARGILWVTSNARYDDPSDTTVSALYAFDAATGRFRSRHAAPDAGAHFFNDLTTGPDGTVYMTDTLAGAVWMLRPDGTRLEPLSPAVGVSAPNGITISDDGRHLFFSDVDHVRVVGLADGTSWRLSVPDSINVAAIDGLAYVRGSLIAHHPLAFWRIARYRLDADHRAVTGRIFIESNTPDSRTATTGEVVGDDYVWIGNGQLDRMNDGTIDVATMDPVRVYRIGLDRLEEDATEGAIAVALSARDSVVLLNPHSLERLATLPVGRGPHEIAVSPDGERAFVADAEDSTITVLSARPARVVATWRLPDGIRVHDVAVTADGRRVWAVSGFQNEALELDGGTGRVLRRVPLEREGGWMVETGGPAGAAVIANLEGGAVTLLRPETGRQTVLPAREGEIDARPTPDASQIWSVNLRDGTATAYEVGSGDVLGRVDAGAGAGRVVFTPEGRTALIVASADSTLVAIDVRTRRRTGSATLPAGPKVIALSADGRRAYVTHPARGAVTLVDVPSLTVLLTVPLEGTPDGVAVLEARR